MIHKISFTAENLSFNFREGDSAIDNINFSVEEGKLIGILGPNGAGKSTLIKAIMGLVKPTSGYVKIYDKTLQDVRSRISYVPQRESVDWNFPASVLDVVMI